MTVEETIGNTFEKANVIATQALGDEGLKNISLKIVSNEESYNNYVDAEYRAQHNYEESKDSLPWLICSYERPNAEDVTPIDLRIKLQGSDDYLTISSNVGNVMEDGKKLTITDKKYVIFGIKNDLGIEQPTGEENFIVTLENNGKSFTVNTKSESEADVEEESQVVFIVSANPEDAIIKLNGIEIKQITVNPDTTVNVEVSKTGYKTVTEDVLVEKETSKNYTLEKTKVNVAVKAKSPNLLKDATIKIGNDNAQQDVPVLCTYDEPIIVNVTQTGYKPFEIEITPTKDTEILVNGDGEWKKPQVSVTTQTITHTKVSGAVIKINGEVVGEGVAKDVDYNTEAVIEVTADGYTPFNETKLITSDYACVANMVAEKVNTFKVTVEPTPDDATVKINGSETKELVVEKDTTVDIEVSKEGYETYKKQITVTEDVTEVVNLVIKQFTLTVNTIPANATVRLNEVEQRQITVDYGSTVKVNVSKKGYADKSDSVVITEDKTIQIELELKESGSGSESSSESGDFLTEATKIIEAKSNYSYLNCGRFFKTGGITEETIKQFYQEFGYFVMSKIDYRLWRMMNKHFGDIDNIHKPEIESESEKPIISRHESNS